MLKSLFTFCILILGTAAHADMCLVQLQAEDLNVGVRSSERMLSAFHTVLEAKGYRASHEGSEPLVLKLEWSYYGNNEAMEWTSTGKAELSYISDSRATFAQLVPNAPNKFIATLFSEQDSRPDEASVEASMEILGRLIQRLPTCEDAKGLVTEAKRDFFKRYRN